MKVAVIGLGEVGRCYASALAGLGLTLEASEPFLSPAAQRLVNDVAITVHQGPGAWLAGADIVISAVTGGAALDAALAAFPFMKQGAVYADFTTASPAEMRAAAAEALVSGLRFVDVAIMGGITLSGAKTPLLCAGNGAEAIVDLLSAVGTTVHVLTDAQPGDAVTMKLLRSVFMKGLEALCVECLTLAEHVGLKAKLYENLADFDQAPLPDFLDMLVRTHVIHAERRYHEVESAQAQLEAFGFQPLVTTAVKSVFERSRQAVAGQAIGPDVTIDEALQILIDTARLSASSTTAR